MVLTVLSAGAEENLGFYISNHDQSPSHRVIHPIVGQTNFVYDAKGALEKIRGEAIAFYVRDSENVSIRNLRPSATSPPSSSMVRKTSCWKMSRSTTRRAWRSSRSVQRT